MNAKNFLFLAVLIAAVGCSGMQRNETPDLYPNDKFKSGGSAKAQAAQQYCMALADEYVKEPDKFDSAVKAGAKGAVVGAAVGGVGGAIMNDSVGRAVGAGAAVGGILGVLKSLNETGQHSPSYQRFVERCLDKEGYEVVGWSVKSPSVL